MNTARAGLHIHGSVKPSTICSARSRVTWSISFSSKRGAGSGPTPPKLRFTQRLSALREKCSLEHQTWTEAERDDRPGNLPQAHALQDEQYRR